MKNFNLLLFLIFVMAAKQYSVEARDAPVTDMIRLLASIDKKNVVVPGDLTGSVVASFPEIELGDALKSILESNQLVGSEANGILQVLTKKTQESLGKDLFTTSFNLKYAKAKDIGAQAKALIGNAAGGGGAGGAGAGGATGKGSILADDRTNSITVRGTQDQIQSIRALIENNDKIDKQVLIEAKIVEASKSFSRNIGVQWGINGSVGPLTVGGLAGTGAAQSGRNLNVGAPSTDMISGISGALGPFGSTSIDAQISAGEVNGTLSILSRPSIVTMNNQPATIQSGLQFYIRTAGSVTIASGGSSSSGSSSTASTGASGGDPAAGGGSGASSGASTGGSNLQQISSGITLVVTPHITPDNKISLAINVVSSQIDFSQMVADIPSINNNTATTTVLLENGATTVIGGLAQRTNSKNAHGIPVLSKIPILGSLFGNSSKAKSDRELLIFITPTVVQDVIKQMRGFSNKNLTQDTEN